MILSSSQRTLSTWCFCVSCGRAQPFTRIIPCWSSCRCTWRSRLANSSYKWHHSI